jgi:hypothetical protein
MAPRSRATRRTVAPPAATAKRTRFAGRVERGDVPSDLTVGSAGRARVLSGHKRALTVGVELERPDLAIAVDVDPLQHLLAEWRSWATSPLNRLSLSAT